MSKLIRKHYIILCKESDHLHILPSDAEGQSVCKNCIHTHTHTMTISWMFKNIPKNWETIQCKNHIISDTTPQGDPTAWCHIWLWHLVLPTSVLCGCKELWRLATPWSLAWAHKTSVRPLSIPLLPLTCGNFSHLWFLVPNLLVLCSHGLALCFFPG